MKLQSSKFAAGMGVALLAVAFYIGLPSIAAQQKDDKPGNTEKQKALSQFMKKKLIASQLILEGLVVEDYSLITAGAKQLQEISSAEQWRISNDAMFRQHSQEFIEAAKALEKEARAKNIDAAGLTWVKTTLSCIECHKWVRAVLVAD